MPGWLVEKVGWLVKWLVVWLVGRGGVTRDITRLGIY